MQRLMEDIGVCFTYLESKKSKVDQNGLNALFKTLSENQIKL